MSGNVFFFLKAKAWGDIAPPPHRRFGCPCFKQPCLLLNNRRYTWLCPPGFISLFSVLTKTFYRAPVDAVYFSLIETWKEWHKQLQSYFFRTTLMGASAVNKTHYKAGFPKKLQSNWPKFIASVCEAKDQTRVYLAHQRFSEREVYGGICFCYILNTE